MWYFAWILGLPLAAAFAVLNAMWFELMDDEATRKRLFSKVRNWVPTRPHMHPLHARGCGFLVPILRLRCAAAVCTSGVCTQKGKL